MSTKINLRTNASYNFVAPEIEADENKVVEVMFPTQETKTIVAEVDTTVAIERAFTCLIMDVEADISLVALLSSNLKRGDMLLIIATAKGEDRTLSFSNNIGGGSIDLTEDAAENILCIFNGTEFTRIASGTGSNGADGSVWFSDSGGPDGALGKVGDYYLDTDDGEVYRKDAVDEWNSVANIKGADAVPSYYYNQDGGVNFMLQQRTINHIRVGYNAPSASPRLTYNNPQPGDQVYFNVKAEQICALDIEINLQKMGTYTASVGDHILVFMHNDVSGFVWVGAQKLEVQY